MTNGMSQMVDERGGSNTNRGNFEAFFDSVYGNAAAEDADFDAAFSRMYGTSAQPAPRQRVSSHEEAMARAQQPGQGEGGFWSGVGEAISEGAKGAGRAVKEGVGGLVVNTVSGLTRLVGTPVRVLTGWEGLHKLANAIDESYANFGAQALESEYGANPDGFGYGAGRFGEKLTGIAGNLGGLAAPGGIAKAAKAPAAIKTAAAAVQKSFPYMFGNNAAVQAYDTARENGKSKAEATALAGLNGAIHFLGFKAFENQSLNKMLGMPKSMEAMMPKWANEAMAESAPKTFTELARSVRNGMIKHTLAERGRRMLKAGGIMALQDMLSDVPMQVAEGGSWDNIDFNRVGKKGLEGLEEGALMEGAMGAAAMLRSNKSARNFLADKIYRNGYDVVSPSGKVYPEPGLLQTPQQRMALMKQNPDATERVLDIIEHGGVARPDELDAAFLPPDMSEKEQRKFAADWRKDLEPYVEEAWNADKPKDALPAPDMAAAEAPRREFISPDEARAQQKAINDAAERRRADNKAQSEVSIDDYTVWNDAYRRGVTNMSLDEWLATKAQRDAMPRLRAPTLEEEADELARRAPEPDEPIKVSPMPEQKTDDSAIADNGRNPDADAYAQAQLLREQVQRRIDMEKQGEKGRKVQKELDNFSKAVRNHMDVFDNDTFGKENAELLSAVEDAIRKNNTQLVKENLNKLIKQVRKFSKRKLQNQEGENDETGNVRNEAPAQPEQGQVERPEPAAPVREEPRPMEGEPPRAEAPREGVVEPRGEETAAEPPKTPQEPPKPAEVGEATPEPEKPAEAVSAAPAEPPAPAERPAERPAVEETPAPREETLVAEPEEKAAPAPTNRLKRADGTDPLAEKGQSKMKFTFHTSVSMLEHQAELALQTGRRSYINDMHQMWREWIEPLNDKALKDLSNKIKSGKYFKGKHNKYVIDAIEEETRRLAEERFGESAAPVPEEPAPEEPAPTNRLRRADGTDPLAEKEAEAEAEKAEAKPGAMTAKQKAFRLNAMQKILGSIDPDVAIDPKALRRSQNNPNGFVLKDLKKLDDPANDGWQYELGLSKERADELRKAVHDAYEDGYLEYHYQSAHDKLAAYERGSGDLAFVYNAVADAAGQAKAKGDKLGESLLQPKLAELVEKVNALSEAERNMILSKAASAVNGKLTPMEKKRRASITTVEGKDIDIPTGGIGGIDGDIETQRELDKTVDRQVRSESSDAARLGRITERDDAAEGGAEKPQGVSRDGNKAGDRHIQLETKGGKKYVVWRNEFDEVVKRAPMDALRALAKASPEMKALVDKLEAGEEIRASKATPESPEERDLRFAADENYQKWLKSRKANDAEPQRERYEREGAKLAAERGRLLLRDADMELNLDREYDPNVDGDGRTIEDPDSGRVVGTFNRETNKLKLFRGATIKTLVHELGGHATLKYAEQLAERGDSRLLDRINRVIDEAETAAPELVKSIRERYKQGKDESDAAYKARLRDEIWAALRERNSPAMEKAIKTLQGKAWYNRAWSAFRDAWKGLLARMGFNRADLSQIDRMSNDEFLSHLDRIMSDGKTLGRLEAMGEGTRANPLAESQESVREARSPRPAGSRIMDDQQTKGEKFKEKFLDRLAPAQSVQDEIGGVEEIVGEDGYTDHRRSTDFVAAADKANGREEALTRNLQKKVDQVENDISQAALKGQDTAELLADFDLYAQCKHAAERNRTIAERNGVEYDADYYYGMGKADRGGERVGLSENVANEIVRELREKYGDKFSHFEDAQKKLVEINREDIRNRVASGRLSAQDANQYLYRWQDYVPLKTDMAKLEPDGFNSSTASMRRNEFMKARGRGNADIADSPFAASVLQAEQGIRGSVNNELLNVAANLVEHAADKGNAIGEIVRGETLPKGAGWTFTLSDGTKVTAGGSMRLAENRPDVLLFKRNGELMAIRIDKGANGRGLALSKAISGENMGRWGSGTEWVPRMTHWMSAMRTQYSPEFIVSNLLADHLEAYQALVGHYGIKGGTKTFAKMVASEISNFKALRNYLKTGMMTRDVGEAVRAGLLTKGGVASEGFEGKEQSIRSHIEDFRRKQKKWQEMSAADWAKNGWSNIRDFISFANEMAEYSTRMGIFSALKKQGVSVKDAVKFARDATVNFNRKGTAMPLINGLYMFANASVQGTVRSVQAMRDEHGKELVGLLVGIGVAKAVLDNVLGDDEEREKSGGRSARNLSDYDRKHNVGVPIPGANMQFAPLRFRGPYAAVPYIAQMATNVALGNQTPEQGAVKLVKELGDQVTEIVGGNGVVNDRGEIDGSLLMQSVAPSVADPIIQLASGKDYKGDERRAKEFDKTTPASSNGKRNTPLVYKMLAQGINAIPVLSGGNENRKGRLDFAPEDIQLIVEFLGAGPARDIGNAISTGQNVVELARGGSPERTLSQVPFVRRVVKEYPENTTRYYNAIDSYERDKAEFNRTTDLKRRAEFGKAHPQVRPMVVDGKAQSKSRVDVLNDRVKELMHLERGEIKNGRKWVERKTPITEAQKKSYHDRRLELQAKVLDILGA